MRLQCFLKISVTQVSCILLLAITYLLPDRESLLAIGRSEHEKHKAVVNLADTFPIEAETETKERKK